MVRKAVNAVREEQCGDDAIRDPLLNALGRQCATSWARAVLVMFLSITLLGLVVAPRVASAASGAVQANATPENAFTVRDAAKLLDQISSGLVDHNRKQILGAFDLDRMTEGPFFEQQITSFLAHTGIIRVHYNTVEAGMEEGNGVASVDFEMDADQRDDNLPPLRKRDRLHLVAEKIPAGWKLIDVQPRSFFSLSQP
jgi:hypothetical protein